MLLDNLLLLFGALGTLATLFAVLATVADR